jgi:hypothetical protein
MLARARASNIFFFSALAAWSCWLSHPALRVRDSANRGLFKQLKQLLTDPYLITSFSVFFLLVSTARLHIFLYTLINTASSAAPLIKH